MITLSQNEQPLPKVTVLLAAYNGVQWLDEQVDSILGQAGVDITLVVSVDQCDDGTYAWFETRAQTEQRITLLPNVKFGSAAQNFFHLIRAAVADKADYICLADQDDIWLESKTMRAISWLNEQQADGYSSDVLSFWPDGKERLIIKSQPQRAKDYLLEAPGPGCTFLLNRPLFSAFQQFVNQYQPDVASLYYHDWFIYAFARAHGFRWVIDDHAMVRYRQHHANEQGANVGWKSKFKRAQTVLVGNWFDQVYRTAVLLSPDDPQAKALANQLRQGRLGFIRLALESFDYRRKRKERWLLMVSCLAVALIGFKPPTFNRSLERDKS